MSAARQQFRIPFAAVGLCLALAQASGVRAQSDVPPPAEIADALTRILAAPDSPAEINRFIGAGALPSDTVAARARALIRELRARRDATEPARYLGAVGQIAGLTSRALSSTAVMGLAVTGSYRPQNVRTALKFGPADGTPMQGFERVALGDARIEGPLRALRRPETHSLLSDGLAGIEKIQLIVKPGNYRIVLITQNPADSTGDRLPFGREVRINGVTTHIDRPDFARLGYDALLTAPPPPLPESGGYRTGTLPAEGDLLFERQQAGIAIFESSTSSTGLTVELSGAAGAGSYLTAMMVEPLEQVSDVALSPAARRMVVSLRQRLELEAEVLAEAASAVEGIEPALGQTPQDDTVVSQDS